MLKDLLRPNDFLSKIDLKDAYLTVPIWIHRQKFLQFIWRDTLWEFARLPFGLASAPLAFSKLLKCCSPVKKNGNQTNHLPRRHAHNGRIQRFYLRTQHQQSKCLCTVPRDKLKSIKGECQAMINNPSVSIRILSRLLGKLSSSIQAVFPAPLHYPFLQMAKTIALKKTQSYESTLSLNQAAE